MTWCRVGSVSWFNNIRWASRRQAGRALEFLEEILMRNDEIAAELKKVTATLAKAKGEIVAAKDELLAKVQQLEDSLTNVDLPEDAATALEEVKAAAAELDNLNVDISVPTPPIEPDPTEIV
jgi:vacuolar-type H+-ATPase subunit E/Vma4